MEYMLLVMNMENVDYNEVRTEFLRYTDKLILSNIELTKQGKPHIHGRFTLKINKSLRNLRDQLRRKFGKSGNDLRINPWDKYKGDGTAYILKEGVGTNKGYSSEMVDNALNTIQEFKKRQQEKQDRKNSTFTDRLINEFRKDVSQYVNKKQIVEYVIQRHINFFQPFLQSNIERITNLLIMHWEEFHQDETCEDCQKVTYKNMMTKSILRKIEDTWYP